jgi:isopentenyl diphosphate isomerase/L-lactate dehydrogenase-like FMN-dependent dehydrogenase
MMVMPFSSKFALTLHFYILSEDLKSAMMQLGVHNIEQLKDVEVMLD